MNCKDTAERLSALDTGELAELEQRQLKAHLRSCQDCRAISQTFKALQAIRVQRHIEPPAGLLQRVVHRSAQTPASVEPRSRFWAGVGVGAALAASIMVAVMSSGILQTTAPGVESTDVLHVALGKPRNFDIAIEMPSDLPNATITVVLTGGIELDGYAGQKELTWTTDLQAGINKLTLPVVATDRSGGQLLIAVGHGEKQRRFTLDLTLPG